MSLYSATGPIALDRLGTEDLIETFGYLDRDPVLNVYLIALSVRDALARPHDEYWAARRDGAIMGILHLGGRTGAVLPVADDTAVLNVLANHLVARKDVLPRRFQVIGTRESVELFAARLEHESLAPRILRSQHYQRLDRDRLAPFEPLPELRAARLSDYDLVLESGARMRSEELEEDPLVSDRMGYARRVEEECREGATWLWTDDRGLCFRASVSARTPDAAQISGVYVPPERRGRGIARRGMSELCARLFADSRSACLFVNDFNAPALEVYRRIGFEHYSDWGSAFYDRP
jgi:uncharacterized protein